MRCSCCGAELEKDRGHCPRCDADLSANATRHELLVTAAFALTACVAMAILVYVVLRWHEYQTLGHILG